MPESAGRTSRQSSAGEQPAIANIAASAVAIWPAQRRVNNGLIDNGFGIAWIIAATESG